MRCSMELEAVKARPGNVGVCLPGGATADLDSFCARRRSKSTVGAEESLRRGQTKERRRSKKLLGRRAQPPKAMPSKKCGFRSAFTPGEELMDRQFIAAAGFLRRQEAATHGGNDLRASRRVTRRFAPGARRSSTASGLPSGPMTCVGRKGSGIWSPRCAKRPSTATPSNLRFLCPKADKAMDFQTRRLAQRWGYKSLPQMEPGSETRTPVPCARDFRRMPLRVGQSG